MADKIKIGIIGIGNMGSGHFNNILNGACPELEVRAVADIDEKRLDWARKNLENRKAEGEEHEDVEMFDDASAMLKSGKIEAAIVAVPHYDHPRYVIEAIENGIHVMSEKPAGVYTKQVREMNEVAKKHPEITFGVMFNQRTNPCYRKIYELLHSGEMGAIRRTSWIITDWYRSQRYYDSGSWRATWSGEGGGVLLNQCPHNLDLFQWLCGMPVKVSTKMHFGKWHDIEVEDDVTAYVEYANGATGTFIATTGDAPGSNRLEISCEKGKIVCDDERLHVWKLETDITTFTYDKNITASFGSPKLIEDKDVETTGPNTQHIGVLNAFAAHILRNEPLIAEGCEGINSLTLSNAMHLSGWLGKDVEIPFDEDLFKDELMKRVATSRRKVNVNSQMCIQGEKKV